MSRPPPREAPRELLVLARWEETATWLFAHTSRWPRSARFPLANRVQEIALEVAERMVVARYEPRSRPALLREANLLLERLRLVLRVAAGAGIMPRRGFESAMRSVDETGRMLHGWRRAIGERAE